MTESQRYCDVVMKGGIASGIVYPNALLALAERYRFKSIGGTSAGAIAAAALAAAALGERRKQLDSGWTVSPETGFDGLRTVASALKRAGFIRGLFQPTPGAGAAYELMVALAKGPRWPAALARVTIAVLRTAPGTSAATLLLLMIVAWLLAGWHGVLAALLPALVCAFLAGTARAAMRTAALLRANQLGLCSGVRATGDEQTGPALTDWLHQVLQSLSGNGTEPLTFQDLWHAPRYPGEPSTKKTLQLAVITTDISHHEPRTLPFENGRFWFCEEEFRHLFPREIVDAMLSAAPIVQGSQRFHPLPRGGALPVLVATRMSLSFPLLLSAIPLYEADHGQIQNGRGADGKPSAAAGKLLSATDALAQGGARAEDTPAMLRQCWFSDGGIGSNFPIHLFDAALPRWPTFAINLTYPGTTDQSEPIFLPSENSQGWQRVYSSFAAKNPLTELAGFLFAIVATMQNWRDLLQSRAPGHRDRIVHVALAPDEGGMNLDMPAPVLEAIATKGTLAGEALVHRFDFNNHWWIRWRNTASALERFVVEFATGAGPPISADYAAAHDSAATGRPPPPSYRFKAGQAVEAQRRFRELKEEGDYWADHDPDLTEGAPRPLPQLRITPTF